MQYFKIDENGYYTGEPVHTEYSEENPQPDNIITVKPPNMIRAKWTGTEWVETGSPPEPDIEAVRSSAIAQTKAWVPKTLEENPLEIDGKTYSVTDEKQAWLTRTILLGDIIASKNNIPDDQIELPWNESGEEHKPWKLKDLKDLALAIGGHVTPFIEAQQTAEKQINEATTVDEIDAVVRGLIGGDGV